MEVFWGEVFGESAFLAFEVFEVLVDGLWWVCDVSDGCAGGGFSGDDGSVDVDAGGAESG